MVAAVEVGVCNTSSGEACKENEQGKGITYPEEVTSVQRLKKGKGWAILIQHILTEYYGPDTILGAGDMRVNKRNKNPYFLASGRGNKIYSRLNHGAVEKMLSVK